MSADADRIAQLTAELAEARKQVARGSRIAEKAREAGKGLLNVADRMEALERTLADVRAAHEHTKAELAQAAQSIMDLQHELAEERAISHALVNDHHEVEAMLIADRDAAQAEAAALRLAVEPAFEEYVCRGEEPESLDEAHRIFMNADAGRALAARVPLLETVATAARTLVTWEDNLAFGMNKKRVIAALAALDEKGTP